MLAKKPVARNPKGVRIDELFLEPPPTLVWKVYKIASKAVWLVDVEAPDEAAAMEKAAAEFKVNANRLMTLRR